MPIARRFQLVTLAALVVLVVLLGGCNASTAPPKAADNLLVGEARGSSQPIAVNPAGEGAAEDDVVVPVASDDPVRGNRLAYVTIVVFSDFQCPFCSRLATTLERVQETYGDDVRIVFKHDPLPFHEHARLAAEVGSAVFALKGPEAFWRYHDMAFRRQQLIAPDAIRAWAMAAGTDSRDVEDGLARKKWAEKVERDAQLAKRLGVDGTPASFINGVSLSGAQPFDKFKDVIDAEILKAKELAQRGVTRDRIYARLATANFPENKADDDDDKPDTAVWKVPVVGSPARGAATALVTIVEFGDFQCSYCKKVQPTLERLRTEYGDRLRFVWKDEPLTFHARANPAAQLARFARAQQGDAGFFAMHDKLFNAQPKLEDADLEDVARAAGLDPAKAMAAVRGHAYERSIEVDVALSDDVSASGTPHFFVNGHRMIGAQGYDKFKVVIEAELTRAEALVRGGVAKTALYETIIKDGKSAPEPERKVVAPSPTAPFRGAASAKVVIEEFSDFQCPFCGRAEPSIDQLLKDYPGKVKVVWRNLPLPMHADAQLAAEAAREAFTQKGNDGFSKMRELLFKNQGVRDGLKRTQLEGYAVQIGLDPKKFGKALDDGTHKAAIDADVKAANDADIHGTPAFVVGSYFVSGAQPFAKFKKLVDRVLTEPAVVMVVPGPATTLPGGLVVKDLTIGTGPAVKKGDTLNVHYVGTLTSGSEFDSSRKQNQPFSFTVGNGQVIKGWDSGLIGMKVGGRRRLTIPPDLGYGDRGSGTVIPPKSTLLFDIELLSIK